MTEVVKAGSARSTRRANAQATRTRMLRAAYRLLQADGYAATTMAAVADEAGVAVQTIYFTFRTKAQLLLEVFRFAADGLEGAPAPSQWVAEAVAASNGRRSIALCVEHGTDHFVRTATLGVAVRVAAATEPDITAQWDGICDARRAGVARIVAAMAERDELRPGLTVERIIDIVSVVPNQETFLDLTARCGWTIGEFKAWAYQLLCGQILRDQTPRSDGDPSATADLSFHTHLARQ